MESNLWIFPGLGPRAQKLPLKWCKWQICGLMGPPEESPNQLSCPSGLGCSSLLFGTIQTFRHYGRRAGWWRRLSLKLESCTHVSYHKMKWPKGVHPVVVARPERLHAFSGFLDCFSPFKANVWLWLSRLHFDSWLNWDLQLCHARGWEKPLRILSWHLRSILLISVVRWLRLRLMKTAIFVSLYGRGNTFQAIEEIA